MKWRALSVCGLLLVLSACSLGGRTGGQGPADGGWTVSRTTDESLELAHPSGWRVAQQDSRALAFEWEQGCYLELRLDAGSRLADLSQSEVLDQMLAEAEARFEETGGQVQVSGRRVWLGQSFIWHELHYIAEAGESCPDCRSGYTIELLAFPNRAESLRARFVCPGSPTEEAEQLLLDVINTVALGSPGAT